MKKLGYLIFCFVLLGGGCSSDPEKKLVGRWQETENPMGVIVFLSNHKGDAYWPGDNGKQESSPMTWAIVSGQRMVTVMTPPGPINFQIKSDRLVAPNGVELTKVQ